MNKVITGVALTCFIAGGAYYLGYISKKPVAPKVFEWSSKLEPETKLGVAYTDITSIVEVCPQDQWLIFKGKGRLLLTASNRYHYSLDWVPRNDISPTKSVKGEDLWNLEVTVNKIDITMSPEPIIDAFIIDKSILVDESEERSLLKSGMLSRLKTMAGNKLHSESGLEALTASIKNHIYQVYASEETQIDLIDVKFSDNAIPALVDYEDYSFKNECTKRILVNSNGADNTQESFDMNFDNSKSVDFKDNIRIHRWDEI